MFAVVCGVTRSFTGEERVCENTQVRALPYRSVYVTRLLEQAGSWFDIVGIQNLWFFPMEYTFCYIWWARCGFDAREARRACTPRDPERVAIF